MNFYLPEWAYWSWETWKSKDKKELHEVLTKEMGWDVTDFGLNDFYNKGMLLFTIRNGSTPESGYAKPYCEKIIILENEQKCLYHFHWDKLEDIINRGKGILKLQLFNATAEEELDKDNPVIVYVDGIRKELPAGGILALNPGQSVTLPQRNYHSFWGDGKVLVGEVSKINDDHTDNRFLEAIPRFPEIVEDEPIYRPLISDYKSL
jgi:hypothetical protein